MKMKHEGYEFELTAEERKTLFFGSRFLVYDYSHRQCYEIIASSYSATLFSSPKNKIISKILLAAGEIDQSAPSYISQSQPI